MRCYSSSLRREARSLLMSPTLTLNLILCCCPSHHVCSDHFMTFHTLLSIKIFSMLPCHLQIWLPEWFIPVSRLFMNVKRANLSSGILTIPSLPRSKCLQPNRTIHAQGGIRASILRKRTVLRWRFPPPQQHKKHLPKHI